MKPSIEWRDNPGSPEAIILGCTCAVMDNHHGAGVPYPSGPRWWVTGGCPLHDPPEGELTFAVIREGK